MTNEIKEIDTLQEPGDIKAKEGGSIYKEYKNDGVYEYELLPTGKKPDKSKAKITYSFGDNYDGSLKRGRFHGYGIYTWANGDKYEGNFKSGRLDGEGTFGTQSGDKYEGNFKGNKYDGEGTYTWANGSWFNGTFKNGQMLSGKYKDEKGNIYTCSFTYNRNGQRQHSVIRLKAAAANEDKTVEEQTSERTKKNTQRENGLSNSDKVLISNIKKSATGAKFINLYSGAAGKNKKAERGLIVILDFFTGSNAEQIARIFKSSDLYDKSKGEEYVTNMVTDVIDRGKNYLITRKAANKAAASDQAKRGATKI